MHHALVHAVLDVDVGVGFANSGDCGKQAITIAYSTLQMELSKYGACHTGASSIADNPVPKPEIRT